MGTQDGEPIGERDWNELRAEPGDRRNLGLWRVVRADNRTREPHAPRLPGDALRHVARAGGPDAAR